MNQPGRTSDDSGAEVSPPLPREVPSPSPLLTATHLFTFAVNAAEAPPWSFDRDERQLKLELVVREVYKGKLDVAPGRPFPLAVTQYQQMDENRGFWSNVRPDPAPGLVYLAIAEAESSNPVALLVEPAIRALVPGDNAVDVRMAMAAEVLRRKTIDEVALANEKRTPEKRESPPAVAMHRLIALTQVERAHIGRLFWGYLWFRIDRPFYDSQAKPLAELLAILGDPTTHAGLRIAMASTLVSVASALDPDGRLRVTRALLELLALPLTEADRIRLIDGFLPNLVLGEGARPASVDVILPDPRTKTAVRAAIARRDSDTARKLVHWLDGP